MRPNYNLELQLCLVNDSDSDNEHYNNQNHQFFEEESRRSPRHEQQEPLTTIFSHNHQPFEVELSRSHRHEQQPLTAIFFDEMVGLSDVQARDLALVASRKMDEAMKSSNRLETRLFCASNLSMKRSLKSFLQKRKLRTQAASPYTIKDLVEGLSTTQTGKFPI